MNNMSLREKIGQLIVTGFPEAEPSEEWLRFIADYRIGNIILFSHNVENKEQLQSLCAQLREAIEARTGFPPLISIDQEGGRVTRLPADATNVPGAAAIAATGRPEHAYAAGRLTARELSALGINFNLAPVLDINNNKRNPVINVRSYGDSAEAVEEFALPMLKGLQDGGVLASLKHFPGHGDTTVDSHLGLPMIEKTLAELEALELKPFVRAIAEGAEAVMTAHILFPALEPARVPATMSREIVTGLLKGKLGFEGLVVSDCLEMDAIRKEYGTAEGAVNALKAGVHLLFISHTPELVRAAVERIERAVQDGELPMSVIDEAVEKVQYYKQKYASRGGSASELAVVGSSAHRRSAEAMSLESVCLVNGELETLGATAADTIFIGSLPYRPDQASSRVKGGLSFPGWMEDAFGAAALTIGIDPTDEEIAQAVDQSGGYDRVVVGLVNGQDHPGQLALVRRLAAAGIRVTAVSLGKPYDLEALDAEVCSLAAFEYTPLVLESLRRILSGEAEPTGRPTLRLERM
ncbi:beta-N-acetylhexosaminidase [Cohnella lubricantis]|uniref:Beta-N-acetylhexosaminidase n=1 Tax=Cohnella lubricantis TaxID=2163172 RepID=A0A841TEL0_9BACL|nr:beta-N-acetylhexosaminidase [Cohnella lubricantis]MBB6678696.1 beta-N-acetylhexosaminidase [Cohnella lubricantis]MBP2118554.1 beta-N-acetylhexosaminidase [Cohnella lubricantis]